jgi:3-phytase
MTRALLLILSVVFPVGAAESDRVVRPAPVIETVPVDSLEDSADDPAIWVHPTLPEKSIIIGTNKKAGLHVYDLTGQELQTISPESLPNNVDVIYDFPWKGQRIDLAVASSRNKSAPGVRIYRIDAETRKLVDLTGEKAIPVFGGAEPYGICGYHSRRDGRCYVFVNHKSGFVHQYQIVANQNGTLGLRFARLFGVVSQPEGLVADDELGVLYVGEEDYGVWKFGAEPDAGTVGVLVAKVGEHGLTADVEGLAIYAGENGQGYLIVSSQGNNTFKVYERSGRNRFVMTIDPDAGQLGKPTDTDGIAVTNRPLGRNFPKGLFVVQDGKKHPTIPKKKTGPQNFKFYAWEDIAGSRLTIDTRWNPRPYSGTQLGMSPAPGSVAGR